MYTNVSNVCGFFSLYTSYLQRFILLIGCILLHFGYVLLHNGCVINTYRVAYYILGGLLSLYFGVFYTALQLLFFPCYTSTLRLHHLFYYILGAI